MKRPKPGAAEERALFFVEGRRLLRLLGGQASLTLSRDDVLGIVALLTVQIRGRRGRPRSPRAERRDADIAARYAAGQCDVDRLADEFNVDRSTIYRAIRAYHEPPEGAVKK